MICFILCISGDGNLSLLPSLLSVEPKHTVVKSARLNIGLNIRSCVRSFQKQTKQPMKWM